MALAQYLIEMVRRVPPEGAPVVTGSTPVISFGDPSRAEVATLGINPSSAEFARGGALLSGSDRRLATLDSLRASSLGSLSDEQVATVIRECAEYFHHRPYRKWFDPLDELLRGIGVSFYDDTACHLDLVQWATDPIWGGIKDRYIRKALLDDGVPHLRHQLANENVRLVLLNGRSVIDQVTRTGLAELATVGTIPMVRHRCTVYAGAGESVRWLGWSTNLQSSFGVTRAFKAELSVWLAGMATESQREGILVDETTIDLDDQGFLAQGTRARGKTALFQLLQKWLTESAAPTIGDVGTFGGKPWVFIDLGAYEVRLNADTKRVAVEQFVRDSRTDPERDWPVIANRNAVVNKVLPGPGAEPVKGWFAYLKEPMESPGMI